jgi:hypothetical protein
MATRVFITFFLLGLATAMPAHADAQQANKWPWIIGIGVQKGGMRKVGCGPGNLCRQCRLSHLVSGLPVWGQHDLRCHEAPRFHRRL